MYSKHEEQMAVCLGDPKIVPSPGQGNLLNKGAIANRELNFVSKLYNFH